MKSLRNYFAAFALMAVLALSTSVAKAGDGIIVAGFADGIIVAGATEAPSTPCSEPADSLIGIIVAGFTGIIVAGYADEPLCGIIVAG
jgi:hypothetical protein